MPSRRACQHWHCCSAGCTAAPRQHLPRPTPFVRPHLHPPRPAFCPASQMPPLRAWQLLPWWRLCARALPQGNLRGLLWRIHSCRLQALVIMACLAFLMDWRLWTVHAMSQCRLQLLPFRSACLDAHVGRRQAWRTQAERMQTTGCCFPGSSYPLQQYWHLRPQHGRHPLRRLQVRAPAQQCF